jgi:Alw26I/Eco31I/Esp3I family type II restriction m6 adenine DNA methyltransferase
MNQLKLIEQAEQRGPNSMDHVAVLNGHGALPQNGKSLLRRATGQFYTHELIGRHLARGIVAQLPELEARREIRIIDPFCGDGRLIVWFLEEASRAGVTTRSRVTLWDCDEAAVAHAVAKVQAAAQRLGLHIAIDHIVGDSFTLAAPNESPGPYDVVITNPPWELVKPDRRELARVDDVTAAAYLSALRAFDRRLRDDYPDAQPTRRFAGWGTNLARVGTDLALRLVTAQGICGVVSPSSLFADSNSEVLRARLFNEMVVSEITYFPAEARLFESVDVPCLTFVASRRPSAMVAPVLTRFDCDRRIEDRTRIRVSKDRLRELGYVVPVSLGARGLTLLDAMAGLPRFASLEGQHREGLWAGRELDETRKERYLTGTSEHPFAKGVNVCRFGITRKPALHVDPSRVQLPPSVRHPRLVWRDVSRPNQKRRVQATLIPPGWVTGNSLGVGLFRDNNLLRLASLLALMSSIPFEYQLRSMLSTGHISLSTVRRVHLPRLSEPLVERLGALAVAVMDGCPTAEAELEVEVARFYGLDKESWATMFDAFPKLAERERVGLLEGWA